MRDAIYRVIQVYGNTDPLSSGKRTILDRNILYGVIQKRFGSRRSKSRVQNDLRFHDAPLRRLTSKLPLGDVNHDLFDDDDVALALLPRRGITAFHERWFHPANLTIALAGGFEPEAVLRALESETTGWPVRDRASREPSPPLPGTMKDRTVFCESRFHKDAVIAVGTVGPSRRSPDYAACLVANAVLTEVGFMGRIGAALRRHGISYHCSGSVGGGLSQSP